MSTDRVPHVPDLILEQYRLSELPREEADRVERLLLADPALRARLESLAQSDAAIARQYPPDWLAQRIRARVSAAPTPARRGRVYRLALGSAFATAMVLLLVPILTTSHVEPPAGDRVKGLAPSLAIYRRTAQGSEKLADGAVARAGDLLRIGYVSAGRDYGLILSIDGRGAVTRHLPVDGERAVPLRGDGTVLLDAAYELDDAPAWERFYFVTADHAFEVVPVLEAARRATATAPRIPTVLTLPRALSQSTFSLQKEVRP